MSLIVDPAAPIMEMRTLLIDPGVESVIGPDDVGQADTWRCPPSSARALTKDWCGDRFDLKAAWAQGDGIVLIWGRPLVEAAQ